MQIRIIMNDESSVHSLPLQEEIIPCLSSSESTALHRSALLIFKLLKVSLCAFIFPSSLDCSHRLKKNETLADLSC